MATIAMQIQEVKETRRRLFHQRSALVIERCHVLAEVDKTQFMTGELKGFIHDFYNAQFEKIDEDIATLNLRLHELRAGK